MCKSLELFVLGCLVLAVQSHTGQISPPQNVSLSWINEFCPKLSWAPPENIGAHCLYYLQGFQSEIWKDANILYHENVVLRKGGPLSFSIQTECDRNHSEPVVISHTYPELVRDFQCIIYSSNLTNCSWLPHKHVQDLQLSHHTQMQFADVNCSHLGNLMECSAYEYKDDVKTGCRLQGNHFDNTVYFVLRGRLNDTPVINTFQSVMSDHVRPPPIHFTLTPVGDQLNVSWTPPDIGRPDLWTYNITYIECEVQKSLEVKGSHSTLLNIDPRCQYKISIKADYMNGKGWTPWSEAKPFSPPQIYAAIYATIIIPVVFAALAALALVCFRKHKEKIFPKIPEPRDLLRILDNNNDLRAVGNLYVPAQEEEECKITLLMDPQENCCSDKKPNL